jgi:exportin-T
LFDSQLYLFETVGTLISLLGSEPATQSTLLQAVTTPLLSDLSQTLHAATQQPADPLPVLKAHHLIRALGNVPKGFPEAPAGAVRPPEAAPWVTVFKEVAEAIIVSLEALNGFKVVREATRFAFARIIAAAGGDTAQFIPRLMSRLLSQFETSELVEFLAFLGLVVHKLQNEVLGIIDELFQPLHNHIVSVLAQPIDGTDAKRSHVETKKAYLEFLIGVMNSSIYPVLVSERNQGQFIPLLESIVNAACDSSDPPSQKVSFHLLARLTTHFGAIAPPAPPNVETATGPLPHITVSGYEQFIFEKLIPLAFEIPASPSFNMKDGQALGVLGEIGVMLKATHKARGQETLDFFANVFLPSKNCPPETTSDFVGKLNTLDTKGFKKYWVEFVRALSPPS